MECRISELEVSGEMESAMKMNNYAYGADALYSSRQLLQATIRGDEEAVACEDPACDENMSILCDNDENSLVCVLSITYYYASNDYVIHRELNSGKGFADLVLIPRKNVDSLAIIIELKYDKAIGTAIEQIKRRQYPAKVMQYTDNLLLVGITSGIPKNTDAVLRGVECAESIRYFSIFSDSGRIVAENC